MRNGKAGIRTHEKHLIPLLSVFAGLQLPEFSKKWSVVCDAVSSDGGFWFGEGIGGAP